MLDVKLSRDAIVLPPLGDEVHSVDVFFDENRVWSIDLRDLRAEHRNRVLWPQSLHPFLKGSTLLSVRDSATGECLLESEAQFTADEERTRVLDADGIPLSVNKWGWLGPALEAVDDGLHQHILDRTEEVMAHLNEMGLRPFVVGGTLLGAVREEKLLPHDDDADIAYLSEHSNPVDVAVEGFEVGHRLQALGYDVMRHSATHMQLHFSVDSSGRDYYVDVFSAFFTEDGHMNQPFHVRGPMRFDQMLPFSEVTIEGRTFPAPADTERWLTINYDEDWRTPIPGYTLETPTATVRRFQNWFGSYNFNRHFWNHFYGESEQAGDAAAWRESAEWIVEQQERLESPHLLEVGSGAGLLAAQLQGDHRTVIATDFAANALRRAKRLAAQHGFQTAHVNLYRLLTIGAPARVGIPGRFDVVANHVLEQVGHHARTNALRLIKGALRSGGTAIATCYGKTGSSFSETDPTTWHLTKLELAREARTFGMGVEFFSIPAESEASQGRNPYAAQFSIDPERFSLPPEEVSLKQRLKRITRRLRPSGGARAEIEALVERVRALEDELDEYRRDSLRVSEILDLVEQTVTPGVKGVTGPDVSSEAPLPDTDEAPEEK